MLIKKSQTTLKILPFLLVGTIALLILLVSATADSYNLTFVPPTPPNATTTSNTSVEINVSVTDADD